MSVPLSVKSSVWDLSVGDEAAQPARGRGEARDQPSALGLACRDILDEVRLRMARRGYDWE